MEYSVRGAQMAVYQLLNLDKEPIPVVRVDRDLRVMWEAFKTMQGSGPSRSKDQSHAQL